MTHTSGIPDYTDMPEVLARRTRAMSPTELLSFFKDDPLRFEPGTDFRYSNSGYIILGAIIERVSGQCYEAFLHREILKPARMHNTGYARREAGHPDRAAGYTIGEERIPIDALPVHYSVLHTAGALYSTIDDMLLWDQALCGNEILSEESIEAMLTPYLERYGYGWVTGCVLRRGSSEIEGRKIR